jgi:hypothetical protein
LKIPGRENKNQFRGNSFHFSLNPLLFRGHEARAGISGSDVIDDFLQTSSFRPANVFHKRDTPAKDAGDWTAPTRRPKGLGSLCFPVNPRWDFPVLARLK